jgi:hypothetical protein
MRDAVCVTPQADMGNSKLQNFIVDDNLGFAKVRIISRMLEMQSEEYAHAHAKCVSPTNNPLSLS